MNNPLLSKDASVFKEKEDSHGRNKEADFFLQL